MDLNKLTMGDRVIAISGILLFLLSFFDWFEATPKEGLPARFSNSVGNAWDFSLTLLAILLAVAMVVLVVVKAFGVVLPDSTPWGLVLLMMGSAAFVLVLIKLLVGVSLGDDAEPYYDVERRFGLFAGFAAAAGLAAGGYLRFKEEGGASRGASPLKP